MEPSRRPGSLPHRPALRVLAAAVAGMLFGWLSVLPAAADEVAFTITDSRITESSGLATDAENKRFWTVNDSGDSGIAYALDDSGDTEGTLKFRADPVDVEAVAFHRGRLYVADIGDNRARRESVTVYFFDAEPADQPVIYKAYDFAYPDGPHDAETLLVDDDGRLFVVTKEAKAGIYAAPASPSRLGVNQLKRVADAPSYVTDGTVLADGRFALRTYVSVEVVDPDSYQVVARAALPAQKQGESITTTFDGAALLIGSEGKRSKVLRVDVPAGMDSVPSAASSPPDAPGSSATAHATDAATAEATAQAGESPADSVASATNREGTMVAIGLAAALAVVAGIVVALVRRT